MIIDLILDRRESIEQGEDNYSPRDFYNDCRRHGEIGDGITAALDGGAEHSVKRELIRYIIENDYSLDIIDFVLGVWWIDKKRHDKISECIKEHREKS